MRQLRQRRGLTIRQLALYSRVSNSYLSMVERGARSAPSPAILARLAPALKVPYTELLHAAGYLDNAGEATDPLVQAFYRATEGLSPQARQEVREEILAYLEVKAAALRRNRLE